MALFVIASLLLCALALAFVLPGLWRGNRRTALALALFLGLGGAGVYLGVGTPDALNPRNVATPGTLEEAIAQLERRLEDEPGNVEGWVLLGRSRMAQQQWQAARVAFGRAHALLPDEPDLMVEFADAQMRAAPDGKFPPGAVALLERVVSGQPNHQRGLFFLGAQRLQSGRPAQAVELWERLLPLLDPQTAQALMPQIAMAREQAGLPPAVTPEPATPVPSLAVTVSLAPELMARVPAGATLYVFARPADGAGPPVAVKRVAAEGFPVSLTLSDADSLMPTQKLSQQAQVLVMARISVSGDAAAATGDLETEPQQVTLADGAATELVISQVHP
jgi:cytochrome c-type biogenesis protein CcmH